MKELEKPEYPIERITDIEEVKKLVRVRHLPWLTNEENKKREERILQMIADSGAILKGHFELGPDQD